MRGHRLRLVEAAADGGQFGGRMVEAIRQHAHDLDGHFRERRAAAFRPEGVRKQEHRAFSRFEEKRKRSSTTVAFNVVFYSGKSLRPPDGFVAIVTMREYCEL